MQKKFIPVICLILAVLPFSYTNCALPNVEVKATLELPIRVVARDWGVAAAETLRKAFYNDVDLDDVEDPDKLTADVYDVNYAGLEEQAFLLHLHTEMTSSLDPNDYLEDVAEILYKRNKNEEYEIDSTIDPSLLRNINLTTPQNDPILVPSNSFPFSLSGMPPIPLGINNAGFLRAAIETGIITVGVTLRQLNGTALSAASTTFNIRLEQDDAQEGITAYEGLSCNIGPSNMQSLNSQFINNKPITVSGDVTITLNPDVVLPVPYLYAVLSISINVQKIESLDWLIGGIIPEIDPISFVNVTKYINHIVYPADSIGLQFTFSDMIPGLEMAMECDALGLDGSDFQPLVKDTPVKLGNNRYGTLWLNYRFPEDPEDPDEYYDPLPFAPIPLIDPQLNNELQIELVVRGNGGGSVLHLDSQSLEAPLRIKGKASFFQDWESAQLNMKTIIKVGPNEEGEYKGTIPDQKKGEDPLNLSVLTKYIEGFSFANAKANLHVRGPRGAIDRLDESPNLYFGAEFVWDDPTGKKSKEDIYEGKLILEKEGIGINEEDLDKEGSYKKEELPHTATSINISPEFVKVMDNHPEKLFFNYNLALPDALTVVPEDFDNPDGKLQTSITTTMMILLPLKLVVAAPGPGIIRVPEMFDKDSVDLFGRESEEEESIFTSIDIEHLSLSIDFVHSFFKGGRLFLEREGEELLFPDGIILDGEKVEIIISGEEYDILKYNLIPPEFRVVFDKPGNSITVPRNIGFDNIKLEAKGKYKF
jgi:hypothetical protein